MEENGDVINKKDLGVDSGENNSNEQFEKKNVILFAVGFIILVAGYFVLSLTDSRGQNWASILSPLMIVSAYITIGISMIIK